MSSQPERERSAACSPESAGPLAGRTILLTNPGAGLYGADRMAVESVAALAGAGARVVVAIQEPGPLVALLEHEGAEVVVCPSVIVRKSFKSPTGMLRLLAEFARTVLPAVALMRRTRPDLVYVNTITSPLWCLVAFLMRRPVICHVHEGEASASRAVLVVLNGPLLMCRKLIVNSEFSKSVLVRALPRLAARSTVVYNAVAGPDQVLPARPVLDPPVRLLYVGRLSPRKGPDVLVRAVGLLRERGIGVRLQLVGAVFEGYEWFEEQLRTAILDAGLAAVVELAGFCSDVWPFHVESDVVVVPSTVDEPFGNTAIEAALSARPLIVSELAGLKEAASGLRSAIRVPAGDPAAIADAVERIAADWSTYRDFARTDAPLVAERYSSSAYAAGIVDAVTDAALSVSR